MANEEDDKTQYLPQSPTGAANDLGSSKPQLQPESSESMDVGQSLSATPDGDPDATVLEPVAAFVPSPPPLATPGANAPRSRIGIGDILKDRFEILESLGEGGMGMVFKAQDLRKVEARSRNPYTAIKVLNPALAKNELLVAGLQRECEKAQELSHPNIITVYDFDRDGDLVFMSMEYLAGQSLGQLIRETAPAGGLPVSKAWPLIKQMALALAYAHTRNIVHSDFKPANVYITHGHEVKVLDFGIAARTEKDHDHDATIFNARAEGGHTPPYASFEMMNGANADPRDDIYAFGLVVYELLTGKHPYQRKPASEVFIEQQKGSTKYVPEPVKGLSRRQWAALKSAIEILQDKRPKNLESWLEQFDPKPDGGSMMPWLAGGAIVLLSVVGFGVYRFTFDDTKPTKAATPTEAPKMSVDSRSQEKAPSLAVSPPVANAGRDAQANVGALVVLDGSASTSGDGESLSYDWRFLQKPSASSAALQNPQSPKPQFVADQAGDYELELVVRDQHTRSQPVHVRVRVEASQPASLHQAVSDDAVVSLSASKAKYRIGEQLRLNLTVSKAGYVRLVYVGATGEVSEIVPNPYQPSKVVAGTEYSIPPKGKFKLQVTGPEGIDRIIAVYGESPIPNLEKAIDADGALKSSFRQNRSVAVVQYDVIK